MRYIYLTIAIILAMISYNFGWFFEGQSAIQAAKQVTIGYDFQEAKASYMFWQRLQSMIEVASAIFLILFAITFFNKPKQTK